MIANSSSIISPSYPIQQPDSIGLIDVHINAGAYNAVPILQQASPMKLQVNCEWSQNKAKQTLYKEVSAPTDQSLEEREFQVIENPNLRVYCSYCELDLTRNAYILTRADYYCVRCFANLEEYPQEYLVRRALKDSFTNSSWDMMDEVMLTTAFKLWGFGNWGQIKEYLDYNCSPFTHKQIQEHFERYYLHQEDYLPPFAEPTPARPKNTFAEMNQDGYSCLKIKSGELKRRDSKGEKKPIPSFRSLSLISSSREIDTEKDITHKNEQASEEIMGHLDLQAQAQRKEKEKEKRSECSILGYNIKRKEFQLGEYDYTAENMLAELEFYETDTPEEHQLKLQIIQAYNRRLEERLKRRSFVIEYKLLDSEYHFKQQSKHDKQSIHFFQSFMRFTKNHEEYKALVDTYSLTKRYEKYVSNLTRMREKVSKDGLIEDSYAFMKKKREKYIQRWEKTYNKTYNDKKRTVLTAQQTQTGRVYLDKDGQFVVPDLPAEPAQILQKALQNQNEAIRLNACKMRALYIAKADSA